jgi:hypothetical protein
VTTKHYYCQYKFQLVVLVGKTKTQELVTDNGNWFKVTARVPNHEYRALYAGEGLVTNTGFVRVNPATFQT